MKLCYDAPVKALKKEFGRVVATVKKELNIQNTKVCTVLLAVEKAGFVAASKDSRKAEDISDLMFQLHEKQHMSMLHTQLLKCIIDEFCLKESLIHLVTYLHQHLKVYLRSCIDNTYCLQKRSDHNMPVDVRGNNQKTITIVFDSSSEWNRLDEPNAELAKKNVASLLEIDQALLQLYFVESGQYTAERIPSKVLCNNVTNPGASVTYPLNPCTCDVPGKCSPRLWTLDNNCQLNFDT